ncbi:hypothetical protein Tco_1007056 [Tanacetum coccineum]|uniref:DUF7138 domain-containing protein n=1 Tax=Tanacetum coccineum TaxID=301880 RepID=A0ABQ5FJM0_9ASTR
MDDAKKTVEFPVVLYNGDRQIKAGNIKIHHELNFQQFRTMLNQMLNISYNNLTTYFVIRPEGRKIVITSKIDFSVLIREKNAYFYVVLKRSRKERRRKQDKQSELMLPFFYPRLNPREVVPQLCESNKAEIWLQDMEMKRASCVNYNYMSYLNTNYHNDDKSSMNTNFPSVSEAYPVVERSTSRALCKDCTNAKKLGLEPSFHLCVDDEIVKGFFRSPVGPICRPK